MFLINGGDRDAKKEAKTNDLFFQSVRMTTHKMLDYEENLAISHYVFSEVFYM